MSLQLGDVVLAQIAFHQRSGSKIRPLVVVLDAGDDDFVAVPITSRSGRNEFDLPLEQWQAASLNVPSLVRIHKMTVVAKQDLLRPLGRLSASDLAAFTERVCHAYCPRGRRPVDRKSVG